MTLAQAARYLNMGEKSLLKLAKDQVVPGTKSGRTWTFDKKSLDVWSGRQRAGDVAARADGAMTLPLGDLLPDEGIVSDLRATDALGVIEEVAARAFSRGWLKNKPWFIGALVNREALSSTAMEGGVAFLHTREQDNGKIARPFIIVGRSYHGIEFGAPDGKLTYLFFLLGLQSDAIHLPILGRLARALKNPKTVSRLRSTSSPTVMRAILLKEDERALEGKLLPVEFPTAPALNREIRKRAIMRVAIRNQANDKAAKKLKRKKPVPKARSAAPKPAAAPAPKAVAPKRKPAAPKKKTAPKPRSTKK